MIVYLMVLHFVGDFLLQSREMGKNKSSQLVWLVRHCFIILAVMYAGLVPWLLSGLLAGPKYLLFPLLNMLVHGVIDKNIWNFYKASVTYRIKQNPSVVETVDGLVLAQDAKNVKWEYWEDHLFYVTIGFDQLLHAATIIWLWSVL